MWMGLKKTEKVNVDVRRTMQQQSGAGQDGKSGACCRFWWRWAAVLLAAAATTTLILHSNWFTGQLRYSGWVTGQLRHSDWITGTEDEGDTRPCANPTPLQCPSCLTTSLTNQDPLDMVPTSPPRELSESLQVAYRRRLVDTIAQVQRQITRLAGIPAVVDAKWAVTLTALMEELDPRTTRPNTSTWDYSARLPDMGPAPRLPNKTRHVCPEVYFGNKYGHPFNQHGMEPENCTYVPKFSSVLTAVLPAQSWPTETINFVITHIRKFYDIPIIVMAPNTTIIDGRIKNVKILSHINDTPPEAELLNEAMQQIKTPYVFIGSSLAHFSNHSSLERLVRVIDELPHVEVVGGAARDLQGHWIHGCLQQRMANYQATYTMGYYYSKYECMYCDDLLTPFITTIKLAIKLPFTAGLRGQAMYRDWFAKVRQAGHLAMVCPDVMFFITNHVHMTRDQWMQVASRWALEKIHSFTGESLAFACENINISCEHIRAITRSLLLPSCCIDIAMKELYIMTEFAEKHGLHYELQSGSVLGAVKFGSYLPWDLDHDLYVKCDEFKNWYQKFGSFVESKNCTAKIKYRKRFLKILCPVFTLDIFCRNELSNKFLPAEYNNTPTTIWFSNRWVRVSSNPGLFSRNKMGFEDLKHMQHSTHFRDLHNPGRPGTWLPCRTPKHHACLDRFPADGNLPFLLT
ncbi:uncharacterized protein [Panulirus ornatus]|uniref:uncharacterized protein isoform X2 n=1 Tax=Panulirus ornatus TaxID=150431 RepID=UPI003A83AE51